MSEAIARAIPFLQCVHCGGELALDQSKPAETLRCVGCDKHYAIKDGIPILLKNQSTETYYDIPWHPVQPKTGPAHAFKRGLKQAAVTVPGMKVLMQKVLYGPNKPYLTDKVTERIARGAVVADIGCRNIPYVNTLEKVKVYLALDIDFTSLRYIKSLNLANVVPILASIDDMPIKSGVVDSVICLEVIEHVENDGKAFAELGRIVSENGTLLLSTPDGDTVSVEELPPPRLHLRHYKKAELSQHLSRYFANVQLESIVSWFPFWRVADTIEGASQREPKGLKKVSFQAAYYFCNFASNICHAVLQRTAYKSQGHNRIVASAAQLPRPAAEGGARGWSRPEAR